MGQGCHQIGLVGEVAAADGIHVMIEGRVAFLSGPLDAAFSHHGVRIAVAQLGDHDHLGACLGSHERRRGAGAAGTDDEYIGVKIETAKIQAFRAQHRLRFQQFSHFFRENFALVRAHPQGSAAFLLIIGMVLVEHHFALFQGQGGEVLAPSGHGHTLGPRRLDAFDQFFQFRSVSHSILLIGQYPLMN